MDTSVDLQRYMHYKDTPKQIVGALLIALTIAIIVYLIVRIAKLHKAKQKVTVKEIMWTKPNMAQLKNDYVRQLDALAKEFEANPNRIRPIYEKMSSIVRNFAYKATGVEVHKYSLAEIKVANMGNLASLIEEFYAPEFDKISVGDVRTSLERTKRTIIEWI